MFLTKSKLIGALRGIFGISKAGTTLTLGSATDTVSIPGTLSATISVAGSALTGTSLSSGIVTSSLTTVGGTLTIGTAAQAPGIVANALTATASTQAGQSFTFTGGSAIAGTTNAGAAAGGDFTFNVGSAARLTSGNAAGGNYRIVPGAGIGTGAAGALIVQQPGGTPGTHEVQSYHNGSKGIVVSMSGYMVVAANGDKIVFNSSSTGAAANNYAFFQNAVNCLLLRSSNQIVWANGDTDVTGEGAVVGIKKVTNSVLAPTDGSTGNGWIQNSGGDIILSSAFTKSNATLGATNLAWTLIAGRTYRITGHLTVSNSTATEGCQFTLAGDGTVTATAMRLVANNLGTNVAGTTVATALAGVINYTTVTGTDDIILSGFIKCGVAGVVTLQAAENTTAVGTLTLAAGSWINLQDERAV